MTRAVDAFWRLPDSGAVSVAPAPGGRWTRVALAGGLPEPALADPVDAWIPGFAAVAGEPVVTGSIDGSDVTLVARSPDGRVTVGFDPDEAVRSLVARGALSAGRPVSARLPFSYRRVPGPVRALVRNLMTRRQARAVETYPTWPVEPSVEVVRALWLHARRAAGEAAEPPDRWPDGRRFALALTQDVDSAQGLARAPSFAADVSKRGLRACWYVVGRDYPLDDGVLEGLRALGGEIGLHDALHDNRIAFMSQPEAAARLDGCAELIGRHEIRGFRSPSMLRSHALYETLRGRFAYDSSMPDTGLLPGPNGCATVFPLEWGGVPVLPLTVPPDGQLLGRGLEPAQILATWIEKTEWIASIGGVAVHLTHPEDGFSASQAMREAFRGYLDWAAQRGDAWHALPVEIMEHWAAARDAAAPARPAG